MVNLTFGEQVKIVLSRKGMTIKELAELMEERTGKKMSRQNLTQRLGRDNFQEQDMRQIAEILECPFQLSILEASESFEKAAKVKTVVEEVPIVEETEAAREVTIGDLVDLTEVKEEAVAAEAEPEVQAVQPEVQEPEVVSEVMREVVEEAAEEPVPEAEAPAAEPITESVPVPEPVQAAGAEEKRKTSIFKGFKKVGKVNTEDYRTRAEKEPQVGEINPYTRREYETNSVRVHPKRIGYVQVYDRAEHKWTDMTEWAFLGYQERKKKLLGRDYVPPTYLD